MERVFEAYNNIGSFHDLTKNHLELVDYHIIGNFLEVFRRGAKTVRTCISPVAKWFERHGLTVIPPHDNEINYTISI